jgi:hypothetical protein
MCGLLHAILENVSYKATENNHVNLSELVIEFIHGHYRSP